MSRTVTPSLPLSFHILARLSDDICNAAAIEAAVPAVQQMLRDGSEKGDHFDGLQALEHFLDRWAKGAPCGVAYRYFKTAESDIDAGNGQFIGSGDVMTGYTAPGVAFGIALAYVALTEGGVR